MHGQLCGNVKTMLQERRIKVVLRLHGQICGYHNTRLQEPRCEVCVRLHEKLGDNLDAMLHNIALRLHLGCMNSFVESVI